ncbi:MAG: hypothetical protein CMP83_10625 [Gammaproteobacteria bacterium]|nr:hypothetical protein [Gammaproteobacteria bacterium]
MVVLTGPLAMGLISGGISATTGVLGAYGQQAAARQKYADDLAFQNANNRFSVWQAGFNAKVQDANKQYQFWQETFNYNQERIFTNSQRNVELMKAAEQARIVRESRVNTSVAYVNDSGAIADAFQEAEMQSAVAQQQYQWRALQARASVQALNQEGNSVDRIVNDYAAQLGDQMTLEAINSDIRERQYTRTQAAQVTQYLSRWNSQTFYNEQQFMDPIAPFAPLPTLITPPPPSRTGAPPSNAAFAMNVGAGLLGGVAQGFSTYGRMKALKTPSSSAGPGTPGGGWGGSGVGSLLQQISNYSGVS